MLFPNSWYQKAIKLLNKANNGKDKYNKIIGVIRDLESNNNLEENNDYFVTTTFLIRELLEYSSKAYVDKCKMKEIKEKNYLPTYVSRISQKLNQQEKISLEEQKTLKGKDIDILNGNIHGYDTYITLTDMYSFGKSYKKYLTKIYEVLADKN